MIEGVKDRNKTRRGTPGLALLIRLGGTPVLELWMHRV